MHGAQLVSHHASNAAMSAACKLPPHVCQYGLMTWLIFDAVCRSASVDPLPCAACRSLNLFVGLTFPTLLYNFGIAGAFLLYATLNVVGGLICVLAMVETRKKSLGAIRRLLTPTNSQAHIQPR